MSKGKEIVLKQHQIDHFSRIISILNTHDYYMDFSRMGTGKTFVTSKISEVCNLPLFVVCPVSTMNVWQQMKEYGVNIVFMISYQSLRGTDKYPPKHPYLTRETEIKIDKNGAEIKKAIFSATDEFIKLVNQGILLIFDEGQSIKNQSDQTKAARALSSVIRAPSKCGFISGSPYDKEEHSENVLRLLSILHQKRLVWSNPSTGQSVPKGIIDVMMYCKSLDNEKTMSIVKDYTETLDNISMSTLKARSLCHHLFIDVIKDHLSSEMMPEESPFKLHMEEAYICISDEEIEDLQTAIQDLAQATRFNGRDVDTKGIQWGAVTNSLQSIDIAMVPPITRFVKTILNEKSTDNKLNKVIISVTYIEAIDRLMESLREYNPLFIDGSVKADERNSRVNLFNSDPKHRVFISTIRTGGISISLHDTVGDFPRHMVVIPTYSIIDIYQALGRIHRTGLQSDASFYMIYGTNAESKYRKQGEIKVTPILNALSRKKDILKGLITKQSSVYKLPGEFDHKYYTLD